DQRQQRSAGPEHLRNVYSALRIPRAGIFEWRYPLHHWRLEPVRVVYVQLRHAASDHLGRLQWLHASWSRYLHARPESGILWQEHPPERGVGQGNYKSELWEDPLPAGLYSKHQRWNGRGQRWSLFYFLRLQRWPVLQSSRVHDRRRASDHGIRRAAQSEHLQP